MMLREVRSRDLDELLVAEESLLVMVAPNFEDRSRGLVDRLLSTRLRLTQKGIPVRPINWVVIAFQGRNSPSFLDGVKGRNARHSVSSLLRELGDDHVRFRVLPYPLDAHRLVSELQVELSGHESSRAILVDFSAIPRNVLFKLMGAISRGDLEPYVGRATEIHLGYSWATHYPEVGSLELIGEVRGQFTGTTIPEFVYGAEYCSLMVLAAGSVHDAYSSLAGVEPISRVADVSVSTVYFMRAENLAESWRQLRNHHGLLRETTRGRKVDYAFSVNHVLDIARRTTVQAISEARRGRRVALAAANFGPKPVVVGTQMIIEEARRLANSELLPFKADLFNSMGSQYLSVYSLGVGEVSIFRLSPTEQSKLAATGNPEDK